MTVVVGRKTNVSSRHRNTNNNNNTTTLNKTLSSQDGILSSSILLQSNNNNNNEQYQQHKSECSSIAEQQYQHQHPTITNNDRLVTLKKRQQQQQRRHNAMKAVGGCCFPYHFICCGIGIPLLSFLYITSKLNLSYKRRNHSSNNKVQLNSYREMTNNRKVDFTQQQQKEYKQNDNNSINIIVENVFEHENYHKRDHEPSKSSGNDVLTVYLQSPLMTFDTAKKQQTQSQTQSKTTTTLRQVKYPAYNYDTVCGTSTVQQQQQQQNNIPFPIESLTNIIEDDPYLPWIHDYFIATNNNYPVEKHVVSKQNDDDTFNTVSENVITFIAQNKRRCDTGIGKESILQFREPQVALFQPISILVENKNDDKENKSIGENNTIINQRYRLADPMVNYSTTFVENVIPSNNDLKRASKHMLRRQHIKETRFICHFHEITSTISSPINSDRTISSSSFVTFSKYKYNYEYVLWRKSKLPMLISGSDSNTNENNNQRGPNKNRNDISKFELSQLVFDCPIPQSIYHSLLSNQQQLNQKWFIDVIPIRTPTRGGSSVSTSKNRRRQSTNKQLQQLLLTPEHIGHDEFNKLVESGAYYNSTIEFGSKRYLPKLNESGRWANLPLCPIRTISTSTIEQQQQQEEVVRRTESSVKESITHHNQQEQPMRKDHYFVACTWTASTYNRRGDATIINDSTKRLKEWILFHKLVGIDHIYIYDNTDMSDNASNTTSINSTAMSTSPLYDIIVQSNLQDYVTYHSWPVKVCSNNRPNSNNPGERSSQYAAEQSCLQRYGPSTTWMTFIDTDEYLVPMKIVNSTTDSTNQNNDLDSKHVGWRSILQEKEQQNLSTLKLRSSRGRPRLKYMEVQDDRNICYWPNRRKHRFPLDTCVQPDRTQTFLKVYNCDYIRPPRPDRFQRAMKQIYRPSIVLSHFVHYTTVTKEMARYYSSYVSPESDYIPYVRNDINNTFFNDVFVNELTEGVLVHTKSVLPYETMTRTSSCYIGSKNGCSVGYECSPTTQFIDELHNDNVFKTIDGNYCNCWINENLESYWIPLLEKSLGWQ